MRNDNRVENLINQGQETTYHAVLAESAVQHGELPQLHLPQLVRALWQLQRRWWGKYFHNMLSICWKLTSIPCWIISLILAIAFCTLPGSSPWKPIMSIVHSPECFVFKIDWFRCSNHLNVSVKGFILPRHWLITNLLQIYQITIAMYNSSSCRKNRIVCRRWSWVHLEAHLHLPLLHASLASDHNLTATHLGEDLCQSIHDYFISAHLFHGFQRIASGPDEQSHKVETRMILLQSNRSDQNLS